ncbi:MAG TPA: hypothetical protein VI159_01590 [Gemmatimonadales bacterium]
MLLGALAFGAAGLAHPFLFDDAFHQLATIRETPHWRLIHWTLLFAFPLMQAGILGLVARHLETPGASLLRTGAMLATFGFGIWALNVLLMVGTGWTLAQTPADPGVQGLYAAIHPFGLAAERLATFTMGVALVVLGRGIRVGKVFGRWLAETGTATGLINVAVAVLFSETSQVMYVGQGIIVAWLAAVAVMMLVF